MYIYTYIYIYNLAFTPSTGEEFLAGPSGAGYAYLDQVFLFFSITLVTGPRRSLSLKLSDTNVYEPQMRALLGNHNTTRCFSSSLFLSSLELSDAQVYEP